MKRVVCKAFCLATLVGLCCRAEAGGPYSGPAPLVIPFGPGMSGLNAQVVETIDRLVVRAQHCGVEGELVFRLHHAPKPEPELLQRREAAIRARLVALGFPIKIERQSLLRKPTLVAEPHGSDDPDAEPPAAPLPPWHVEGSVQGNSDFCFEGQETYSWSAHHPRLLPWLVQLEQALAREPVQLPAFWQKLSSGVRRNFLSPSLAKLAHERTLEGNTSARKVFWWLVDQDARRLPPEGRLQWALYLWQAGSDEDLRELQRRLVIAEIGLDQRAGRAPLLMNSLLPWSVIEQRLMAPGLMRRAGELLMPTIGQIDSRLNMTDAVLHRKEWASWGRLTRAANELRTCFLGDAILQLQLGYSDTDISAALAKAPIWAAGPAGRFREGEWEGCNPTAALLSVATGCGGTRRAQPEIAARWLDAGLIPDDKVLSDALSPKGLDGDGACRIERAPGQRFPYRLRTP